MALMPIEFTVYGKPAPAGSKRGFYNARARRVIITDDSKNSRPWKALVSDAAVTAMRCRPAVGGVEGSVRQTPALSQRVQTEGENGVTGQEVGLAAAGLLSGPLVLEATFYFPRPKAHYGTGRNADQIKPGAPLYPAVKPDTTKLLRALEDALTGIVYKDDAQVVNQWARKLYGEPARCEVRVEELGADVPEIERALKRRVEA